MSYSVTVTSDKKGKYEVEPVGANLTFNLTDMFKKVVSLSGLEMENLKILNKTKCNLWTGKFILLLNVAMKHQTTLEQFNPKNGWGSFDTLLETFNELLVMSLDYPDCYFDVY